MNEFAVSRTAIALMAIEHKMPVVAVSIAPVHLALGYTQVAVVEPIETMADLEAHLAIIMGGIAAEEVITGTRSTGLCDDMAKASALAAKIHQLKGASDPETLLADALEKARAFVESNRANIEKVAATLVERQTLTGAEVTKLLGSVH